MNKTCSNCRQLNPPQAAFCLNCAASLPQSEQQGGWQNNQPNFGAQPNFMTPIGGFTGEASSRAKWACGLGILGIFCLSIFASVPAIFIGWAELNAIKQGQSSPNGKGLASFGFWSGISATVFHFGLIALAFLMALADAASSPYDY